MGGANEFSAKKGGDADAGGRRKNKIFAPVTMKMIQDAIPRPDDVCEIDGEAINDVYYSIMPLNVDNLDHYCWQSDSKN